MGFVSGFLVFGLVFGCFLVDVLVGEIVSGFFNSDLLLFRMFFRLLILSLFVFGCVGRLFFSLCCMLVNLLVLFLVVMVVSVRLEMKKIVLKMIVVCIRVFLMFCFDIKLLLVLLLLLLMLSVLFLECCIKIMIIKMIEMRMWVIRIILVMLGF